MSRIFSSLAILFTAIAFCATSALAFDVSVKANVDNAQVFVGDMFNYEIQVVAPENAIVDLPSFVGNLGSFEVKEMKNEKVTEGMPKGTAKFTWLATLNTFVSGDFLIAPQQVNAVVGSDTVKVSTDPVAVKVSTRTTGEEEDIIEVEDPLDDPRLPQWLYIVLIVVGVLLLVFLGWFLHKKFAKAGAAPRLPKYSLRGKGIVPATFYSIFSPETVRYVFDAYQRLQVNAIRDIYTKEHIDGLGENFMRERIRQQALKTYQEYMERYALEQIITLVVNDQNLQAQPVKEMRRMATNDANKDVMRIVSLPETFDELLKRYRQLEKDWYERVTHGLDKDNERGRQIFDDYDDAHPIDKGFTEWEKSRVEEKLRRLNSIAKTNKPE